MGVGASLELRLGGKTGIASGEPLDVQAEVLALEEELIQLAFGAKNALGNAAVVRAGRVDIVLTSRRSQAFEPALFEKMGIDLRSKDIIAVKSTHHFYDRFAPIAADVIYLDTPGVLSTDLTKLTYTSISRPKWSFDAEALPPRRGTAGI